MAKRMPNDGAWPRAWTAFMKALGYYLAYRVIRYAAAEGLRLLIPSLQAAGLFEGLGQSVITKLFNLGIHLATLLALVLWFWMRRRPFAPSLGLAPLRWRTVPLCVLCGVGATVTVSWLYEILPFPAAWVATYAEKAGAVFEGYSVWTFVVTVIAAPWMEELVFRGLVFRRLREGLPFWAAALLSAAVFGAAHASFLWMLYAFVLGLLLAWLTEITGSLWASVLCHVGFNLMGQVSLAVLPFPWYAVLSALGTALMLFCLYHVAVSAKHE